MSTRTTSQYVRSDITKETKTKTGGPKTVAGKRRTRLNALSHGLYARELVVTDSDKPEFEKLQHDLRECFKPSSVIQQIALERLVSAGWRYKLVLRMEALRLKPYEKSEEQPETSTSVKLEPWYGTSLSVQRAIRQRLCELRENVSHHGGIHLEEHQPWLSAVFGSEFYTALYNWRIPSPDVVLLAEHLTAHAEDFKKPLPGIDSGTIKTNLNTHDRWDMMLKLIDLKILQMDEFHEVQRGATSLLLEAQGDPGIDAAVRYVTSAARELERAYDWYMSVSNADRKRTTHAQH